MKRTKDWLALASTRQPDGTMRRSLHIVYGTLLATSPVVRQVEDEEGVSPGFFSGCALSGPDVMLLVAPGVELGVPFYEALELVSELVVHECAARRAGQESARELLAKQAQPEEKSRFEDIERELQEDIIEAGAEWLRTGVQPPPSHRPIWVGEEE